MKTILLNSRFEFGSAQLDSLALATYTILLSNLVLVFITAHLGSDTLIF